DMPPCTRAANFCKACGLERCHKPHKKIARGIRIDRIRLNDRCAFLLGMIDTGVNQLRHDTQPAQPSITIEADQRTDVFSFLVVNTGQSLICTAWRNRTPGHRFFVKIADKPDGCASFYSALQGGFAALAIAPLRLRSRSSPYHAPAVLGATTR